MTIQGTVPHRLVAVTVPQESCEGQRLGGRGPGGGALLLKLGVPSPLFCRDRMWGTRQHLGALWAEAWGAVGPTCTGHSLGQRFSVVFAKSSSFLRRDWSSDQRVLYHFR